MDKKNKQFPYLVCLKIMLISRLIDKNFSEYEDEKLYSVLMDEEELRLYSEFLEEREYAKPMTAIKSGWRHFKREFNPELWGASKNIIMGKDLTPEQVKKITAVKRTIAMAADKGKNLSSLPKSLRENAKLESEIW